jgi:hypothetical protein
MRKDGERIVNWLRLTLGLRKIDGRCKVVHEHVSAPFDMKTGKAMLNKAKLFHVTRGARAPTGLCRLPSGSACRDLGLTMQ